MCGRITVEYDVKKLEQLIGMPIQDNTESRTPARNGAPGARYRVLRSNPDREGGANARRGPVGPGPPMGEQRSAQADQRPVRNRQREGKLPQGIRRRPGDPAHHQLVRVAGNAPRPEAAVPNPPCGRWNPARSRGVRAAPPGGPARRNVRCPHDRTPGGDRPHPRPAARHHRARGHTRLAHRQAPDHGALVLGERQPQLGCYPVSRRANDPANTGRDVA